MAGALSGLAARKLAPTHLALGFVLASEQALLSKACREDPGAVADPPHLSSYLIPSLSHPDPLSPWLSAPDHATMPPHFTVSPLPPHPIPSSPPLNMHTLSHFTAYQELLTATEFDRAAYVLRGSVCASRTRRAPPGVLAHATAVAELLPPDKLEVLQANEGAARSGLRAIRAVPGPVGSASTPSRWLRARRWRRRSAEE